MARPPLLDAAVPADEALRVILFEALGQVSANLPAVTRTQDGEALHQLRVGLRRLRTALRLTKAPELADLDVRAKRFLNLAGPPREFDVFLAELFAPAVTELGAQRGFDRLRERTEQAREAAWASVIADFSGAGFEQFEDDVAAAARAVCFGAGEPVGVLAPLLLNHGMKRARKRGAHFGRLAAPERHAFRKILKRLRYTAEFFAPLYTKKSVGRWLEPLKELQDMLGHLNDVAEVHLVLGRLMPEGAECAAIQADLATAAEQLHGFHQARAKQFAVKTHRRWKAFRRAAPFWG